MPTTEHDILNIDTYIDGVDGAQPRIGVEIHVDPGADIRQPIVDFAVLVADLVAAEIVAELESALTLAQLKAALAAALA